MMRIRKADRLRLMLVTLSFLLTLAACDGGELATPTSTVTPKPTSTPTPTPEPLYDVEEARAELAAARDIWESKGSEDYTIEYIAFYLARVPMRLTVRNAVIESATYLEGPYSGMPVPPERMSRVLTIDGLFDKIEKVLSGRPVWSMGAEYDAEFGYPRDFGVSYTNTPDDYFEASICCYTPLAPPPPTANPTPVPGGIYWPCNEDGLSGRRFWLHGYTFIHWNPDGSRLIFNEGIGKSRIMIASVDGSSIHTIVEVFFRKYPMPWGYHADISQDGTQLVYTSCQFPTEISDPVFTGDKWYSYEIATISLDGGEPKRLTDNRLLDHVPVWSPDGSRIAFVADPPRPNFYLSDFLWKSTRLYTMAADGTDVRDVVPSLGGVTLSPPEWSPDGQRLAFVVEEEGEEYQRRRFLYTVALDGSELRRISEAATSPSWSPDGKQLAFGRKDVIYTVKPDGTDEQKLVDAPGVRQVSWSPGGKEILFVAGASTYVDVPSVYASSAYVFNPDGNRLTKVYRDAEYLVRGAWSPDGSRIAFFDQGAGRVVSVARDGTDLRLVARKNILGGGDNEYEFVAGSP